MPTGYTHNIKDGISFEDFVMQCARAMGACVMMRDDSSDVPIPKFEPSDYDKKQSTKLREELEIYDGMTLDHAAATQQAEISKELNYRREREAERANQEIKYREMLALVRSWEPPTGGHEGLKKFMTEQITDSIDFDCGALPYPKIVELPPQEWLAEKISNLASRIDDSDKRHAEEIERTNSRNEWVSQLRESLGIEA